ncbi:MAG: family 10 glycosylhydrolase [Flavipsychrobacter sp.]|nr:family 10 glycosylhydrolase [Flavipsychrobacter sp.]
MKKTLLLFSVCIWAMLGLNAQTPKREFRGAWIASYFGIDWPNRNQTPAQQQAALISILDHHKATGITTIFLQVRSQSDALYPSELEPWSNDLTGLQGRAPNPLWDPLAFAIEEAHKRGMELHAWINPYRAVGNAANLPSFADNHIAKQHPEWLISTGVLRTLDPGIPGVRDHINAVISDIVSRYDVDGIHFDDYFYPNAAFNDDATYAADPRGIADRADWRRDNVNLLVTRINQTIKQIKPWVEFGISPSGIYRNSTDPSIGSATSGLQHYSQLYADSKKWLQEGWIDYLAPQVYWYIGQPGANYGIVTPWWNNNSFGRRIYIGLAGYKVNDPAQGVNWANPSQIPNQVRLNRSLPNISGQAVYNTASLRSTTKLGFRDSLRLDFYSRPALQPTMPWIDAVAPDAATDLRVIKFGASHNLLKWKKPAAAGDELNRVRQFAIYRASSTNIDIETSENLIAITNQDETSFEDHSVEPDQTYYYLVTSLDRLHNESAPSNTATFQLPVIVCPANQQSVLDENCSVAVPDFTAGLPVQEDITYSQEPLAGTVVSGAGTTTITLRATDIGGNTSTCSFEWTRVDETAPLIAGLQTDKTILKVPNHKMNEVAVNYTVSDNCGPVTVSLAVNSNEPVNGTGDGNTSPDWEILNNNLVKLRAERSGTGSGRIYTITVTATDAAGNESTASTEVRVPHSAAASTSSTEAAAMENSQPVGNWVKLLPNPTTTSFTLRLLGTGSQQVKLRMLDLDGRVIESRAGIADNATLQFGGNYRPGNYFVEIQRGKERLVLKLIKQ